MRVALLGVAGVCITVVHTGAAAASSIRLGAATNSIRLAAAVPLAAAAGLEGGAARFCCFLLPRTPPQIHVQHLLVVVQRLLYTQ